MTVQEDIDLELSVNHDKTIPEKKSWRSLLMLVSTILPVVFLGIECILNKIIYPKTLWLPILIYNCLYLFWTFIVEVMQGGSPVYYNNLNWTCTSNWIYIVSESNQKVKDVFNNSCEYWNLN
jgi:hypothetical protein